MYFLSVGLSRVPEIPYADGWSVTVQAVLWTSKQQ